MQVETSPSATAKKKRKVGGAGEAKGGAQAQQPPPALMKATTNLQGQAQVLTPAQLQSLLQQVSPIPVQVSLQS